MPSAYIIANVSITNPAQYEQHKTLPSVAMQTYGAEVRVRGGRHDRRALRHERLADQHRALGQLVVGQLQSQPELRAGRVQQAVVMPDDRKRQRHGGTLRRSLALRT